MEKKQPNNYQFQQQCYFHNDRESTDKVQNKVSLITSNTIQVD